VLILHAVWLLPDPASGGEPGAALAVWGEAEGGARRRATASRAGSPAHPFGASIAELRQALSRAGFSAGTDGEAVALLPAHTGQPLHSATEAAVEGSNGAGPALALQPFKVHCLLLDAATAVDLLTAFTPEAVEGSAVPSADLRFWQQAALFVLSLLSRQRLLPDLRVEEGSFVARWQPLITSGAEAERLAALAAAMPAATRALTRTPEARPAGPRTLLRDFVRAASDALARRALAGRVTAPPDATPAQAWLAALCGRPQLAGRPVELSAFRSAFHAWSRPGGGHEADASYRLCLRLQPPDGAEPARRDGDPWRLEYLVQASDDPSLIVPAGEVWQAKGSTARFLDRRFDHPQERLLASLGRAARLFEPVERSLKAAAPESVPLESEEAYRFVRDAAPVLNEAGFGVLVPGMENRLSLRLKLSSGSSPAQKGGIGAFGWEEVVAFDWEIAIGDEVLSRSEFEALVGLKAPLVNLRGQWVELRPEAVEKTLALLRRHGAEGELQLADALRLALAPEAATDLPVTGVELDGVFREVVVELQDGAARVELAEPPGFTGSLRPYQRNGLSWLATLGRFGLGACLADDMGLGKTVQLIATLLYRREADGAGPALLICPTSVVANWRRELERFAPELRVLIHHGVAREKEEFAPLAQQHDVVISTYALLHRDAELFGAIEWGEVVLDEAQNIKNPGTRAAQAARSLHARWRAALTGTPVENRLEDLWSIFQFLNPGLLGTAQEFRRTFGQPIERLQDATASARLQRLVGPFILRRLKSDKSIIADLPEKNEATVFCTLTREQATLYQAVLKESLEAIEESEGIQRRGQILATLTKLKQVCDHPALLLHDQSRLAGRSGKLARLQEMLEEVVSAGDRALVFTQYAEMGTLLQEHLQTVLGHEVLFLHGGTSASARERMVTRFQAEGYGPQVFILSIRAGGTGLNLTRANHVFHFDRWWNPAVENQATDRAFRIGQRRDVQVHKYVCAGTFEETLDQLIARKLALAEAITGTSESWITELSPQELRDVFALRTEVAVAE
jgi:SNF2 family DNA or RNA helicase